ncbi:class I SAM-dependent methyltransferase [Candidatus Pacearchaeota archaeon]|nr:class I SAM-dependent methyltransferase [Candidatus Pacearchaeota archaeon]
MFTGKDINLKFQEIRNRKSFKQFNLNKQLPPIETYKDVDWSTAGDQKFVEIVFGRSEVGGIHGNEALLLTKAYKDLNPKLTVEIGRMNGLSTRLLAALCKSNGGNLISFDGLSGIGVLRKLELMKLEKNVKLVEGWVPWIKPDFSWDVDFLFIDGDHTYMSILVDYHYFNYFVKKGGYIAFHDMNMKDSQKAVKDIMGRDPLEHICTVGRLGLYKKLSEREEKYFEIVKRRR